jgi:hypothetical protein
MNDRSLDELLDAWLDLGPTMAPERIAAAASYEARSTRQARAWARWPWPLGRFAIDQRRATWWPVRRGPTMNPAMRLVIAATVIAVAALIGINYLVAPNIGTQDLVGASPTPPVPSPSATLESEAATDVPEQTDPPGNELPLAGVLEAGRYSYANPFVDGNPVRDCEQGCSDYSRVSFTLPAGWATTDGLVHKHLGQPGEVAFSFWTVGEAYLDPCHWRESPLIDLWVHEHAADGSFVIHPDVGLQTQVGRNGTTPVETSIGGQPALRIDLSVPAELDIATCDAGQYRSWSEWDVPGGGNTHHAAGQVDWVYIVDVDRRELVIDASHGPDATAEDIAELEEVLASMSIAR